MGATTPACPGSEYQVPPTLLRVDAACDQFEAAARAGLGPRIEEYLAGLDAPCRRTLLRELLLLEIELAPPAAGATRPGPYRARFPSETDVIDAAFAEAARDLPVVAAEPAPRKPRASRLASPTIGRYVIVAKLVEDSECVVYRVLHPGLGKELVLRWARGPLATDAALADSLAEEGRRLADLDHPNLVRVIELGDHEGRPFLVIEDLHGLDLAQHSARLRPSARSVAAIVADLASAVAYLHGRGVVHQDIRPGNVMIDTTGRPRLILSAPTRLRHTCSTSCEPDERCSPAMDVFDLGALLYGLLTGEPIERGATASLAGPAPGRLPNPRVPKALEPVCLRALSHDPAIRYLGPGDLEKALRLYLRRRFIIARALTAFALLLLSLFALLALE
jgi:eukaryotic-like serine/threonine-protein kinase